MKKNLTILLLLLVFKSISQDKNLIQAGIRLFKETDTPFSFKRKLTDNEYVYNFGFGARAKYLRVLNKRIMAGFEIGAWYFLNNAKNVDNYNDEYKTRNMVTPFMGTLHFIIYRKNLNWVNIGLKAGTAYLQNIHKLNDNSVRVLTKWTSLFEVSITTQLVVRRRTMRIFHFGYGCNFLDGKILRGIYVDPLYIHF